MRLPTDTDFNPRDKTYTQRAAVLVRRATGRFEARARPGGPQKISVTFHYGPTVVALLLIAVILLAGFLAPPSQHFASLLVAAPAMTAAFAGPCLTGVIAALSCGAAITLDSNDGLMHSTIPAIHLTAILLVSGFVIAFRIMRERNLEELMEVRAVSEAVQRVLLRPLPPQLGSLRISSMYSASHRQARIGGDLYAVARTADGVRVVIGDVRGKGLPAVDDAAALLGAFREAAYRLASLPELMAYLEDSIRKHFQESILLDRNSDERFITALVLEVPDVGDTVQIANCGHCPPLLLDHGQISCLEPQQPSPPLGLNSLNKEEYHVDTCEFSPGSFLLLYTDGIVEARDTGGLFYDLDARIATWAGSELEELLQYIFDGLLVHMGGQLQLGDDVAMVAVQRDVKSSAHLPRPHNSDR
jgi:serine phosphatase RsbU (regulator of sigma subunit)